jgi:hypothetical protein
MNQELIKFFDYDAFFLRDWKRKYGDLEFNICPKSCLEQYEIFRLFSQLTADHNIDSKIILRIIELAIPDLNEKMLSNPQFIDHATVIYQDIVKKYILDSYIDKLGEKAIQDYLTIGNNPKDNMEQDQIKHFDEFAFRIMEVLPNVPRNINLLGIHLYIHYLDRKEAKRNIENINQILSCIIETYGGTRKEGSSFNAVRDLIDDYKMILGRDKVLYKKTSLLEMINNISGGENGQHSN